MLGEEVAQTPAGEAEWRKASILRIHRSTSSNAESGPVGLHSATPSNC